MKKFDIYKDEKSKIILEALMSSQEEDKEGVKKLEEGFKKLEEKTADATVEKHVPFVEECETGYCVKIGKEAAHPMTPEHYIQFIELIIDGDQLHRKYLKPGDEPSACFEVAKGKSVVAREYCNLHGLWKK